MLFKIYYGVYHDNKNYCREQFYVGRDEEDAADIAKNLARASYDYLVFHDKKVFLNTPDYYYDKLRDAFVEKGYEQSLWCEEMAREQADSQYRAERNRKIWWKQEIVK